MNRPELPTYRYGPSRLLAATVGVVAVIAAVSAYLAGAATGRLLLGSAAVVLAAVAGVDLIFWPRLTASAAGVAVFGPSQRLRLRWSEIDSIQVDERSHRGLPNRAVEIEAGEALIVLSKRSLGQDPRDVYAQLISLRGQPTARS